MEKYTQIKVLGKGSFGSAWLIRRNEDRAQFVAKEVRLSGLKPAEREAAKHEIDMLRTLNHPNITKYVDHFEHRGSLFIVMEYANGGDLYMKIKERRGQLFTEREVLHYFAQICLALAYLHDRRILHRDLKTQNVFLTRDGVVKLGDFGISTVLRNTYEFKRTVCGTPYYFSPELCLNRPYNNKSDVWALGCILYEMATLNHAFDGNNMKALVQRILKGVYPPVSSSYSPDLSTVISAMLQTDPARRPNASQIVDLPFIRASLAYLQKEVHAAKEEKTSVVPASEQQRMQQEAAERLIEYNIKKEKAARAAEEQRQRTQQKQREAVEQQALLVQERKRELEARVREQHRLQECRGREQQAQKKQREEKWERNMQEQAEQNQRRREQEEGRRKQERERRQQQQESAAAIYREMRKQAAANRQHMHAELGIATPVPHEKPPQERPPPPRVVPSASVGNMMTQEQLDARTEAFWQMRREAAENRRKARGEAPEDAEVQLASPSVERHSPAERTPHSPHEVVAGAASNCATVSVSSPGSDPQEEDAVGEEGYRAFLNGEAAAEAELAERQRDEDYNALETAISLALGSAAHGEKEDFQDDAGDDLTRFVLDGETLQLPNVEASDPLMHRIESLRLFLEQKMGDDALITCYKAMNNISAADDDAMQRVSESLPKEHRRFLPLVMQLIVCEDVFNRQGG